MKTIDGRALSQALRQDIAADAARLKAAAGVVPGLAVILVGDNPASVSYVTAKEKACAEAGFFSKLVKIAPGDFADTAALEAEILATLAALNEEILACRRELERGNALSPERAEHLRSTFRALSENLRDMRERARALREELEPENVEARRAFFRDLRERCAPLIDFTKSVLF